MMRNRKSRAVFQIAFACAIATMSADWAEAQWQQQYNTWQQGLQNRYQQWQAPPQEAGNPSARGLIDLFSGNTRPGRYDVRLPFGMNLRVNVDEQRQQYQDGRAPHTIESVLTLSQQIRQSLSYMQSIARRFGSDQMEDRIEDALEEIEELAEATQSGDSLDRIRERAIRFDNTWHELESYLRNSRQIGPRMRTELDRITDYDNRLHRTIEISPSHGYARLEAVAVARRIKQQTESLLSDLQYRARPGAGIGRVLRNIRDAYQQAEDLYWSIEQGESYEAVRTEYQQFDRAWHEAVRLGRTNRELSRSMWRQHREIDQLDTRMHDLLQVDSPLAQGKRTWVDRSHSLAKSADDFLRYVRNVEGRSGRGQSLRREAEDVAFAADDFYQWFEAGNRDMVLAEEKVGRIAAQWRDVDRQLDGLSQQRYPNLFDLARQVDRKLQQLQDRFG